MNTTETKAQHTPGPWTHKATAGNHDFSIYPESTGRDVALVRDYNESNARLIAAAPELLEALKECITYEGAMAEKSHAYAMRRLASITEIARAAIAKATK